MKRLIKREEWYYILKIECIFYAIVTAIYYFFPFTDFKTYISTILSALVSTILTFGTAFCIQWLILRIPLKK